MRLPRPNRLLRAIGFDDAPFVFQVQGPGEAADALSRLTDTGHVPEALRLAHLIGAAVVHGVSSNRA